MDIGETGEARMVVGVADSAKALSLSAEDDFPHVLATSRMIALMELAASRPMRALLGAGQLSVGVGVDVRHLAATPVGIEVRAVATFQGMDGKLYRFRVEAFDRGGRIGAGEHTRAIVGTDRLLDGATTRTASRWAQDGQV
jgi:fluoroacetyl-CoA thioesterase